MSQRTVNADWLCISRKVKKSESKSQPFAVEGSVPDSCVYPVKLKNLKANHNLHGDNLPSLRVVYIP